MELVVTIRSFDKYRQFVRFFDGIIIGKYFTSAFDLSKDEMKELSVQCKKDDKKCYVVIDDFISENDKLFFYEYFDFVVSLNPDGIYFHDLAVMDAAKKYGVLNKLIYDGKTLISNSLEAAYYLNTGIDSVVIARELTLEEIMPIIIMNKDRVDMQLFGHLRMSYSKRWFLNNYFKEIDTEYDYYKKESLTITEENRDYHMPIYEDKNGTKIYTDYIFDCYEEYESLKDYLRRGIIDTLFVSDKEVIQYLRDLRRINRFNAQFLKYSFERKNPEHYGTGYLYVKTNKSKDEQD
ncbi:MAG: U32 family peptidase [Erysipelotrichaceae bacterium]|nr:U32 family peptidase [Erysipelotrichaceae bacterium]